MKFELSKQRPQDARNGALDSNRFGEENASCISARTALSVLVSCSKQFLEGIFNKFNKAELLLGADCTK